MKKEMIDDIINRKYEKKYHDECKYIWDNYVPKNGQADCLQGELLREIEAIKNEAFDNGNVNWNDEYSLYCDFIKDSLTKQSIFSEKDKNEIILIMDYLKECGLYSKKVFEEKINKDDVNIEKLSYTNDNLYDIICDKIGMLEKVHPEPIPYGIVDTGNDVILNVERPNTLDGMAYDKEHKQLVLLLSDGMDWSYEDEHLLLLQEKINNYIAFIEAKEYLKYYNDVQTIKIEMYFDYKISDKCKKFLDNTVSIINESLKNTTVIIKDNTIVKDELKKIYYAIPFAIVSGFYILIRFLLAKESKATVLDVIAIILLLCSICYIFIKLVNAGSDSILGKRCKKNNNITNTSANNTNITDSNKEKAIDVLKSILLSLHNEKFNEVTSFIDESEIKDLVSFLKTINENLKSNGFNSIDEYGVNCNFNPQYEYSQLTFYAINDTSGFRLNYDLTSNGELTNFTLMLKFIYTNDGLKCIFENIDCD